MTYTDLFIEVSSFSIFEADPPPFKRWSPGKYGYSLEFQGGGFNVWIKRNRNSMKVKRDKLAHTALVIVQANGGSLSQLRDATRLNKAMKAAHALTERTI